jgi:hypothetical protein
VIGRAASGFLPGRRERVAGVRFLRVLSGAAREAGRLVRNIFMGFVAEFGDGKKLSGKIHSKKKLQQLKYTCDHWWSSKRVCLKNSPGYSH